ncbi:dienelactone hydrolase family protein [Ramlibacter sp.]|uniref:dienelactone hydrolase family protein n=1 Tax=Ramlibacter sp. TaxID=1917967 RepID=UPI00261870E2|nr:dienelactone hydrolase family protein [Ramlibacter sp.]MDB5955502.1 carboxymethylenebutenolidase [Ramlibacter sp.]
MAWIELKAADGHTLQAWEARPTGAPRGAVVVLQEIFGVNSHVRAVCDRLAAQGWLAVAPALFDRFSRGCELGYDQAGMAAGRAGKEQVGEEAALRDVQAAISHAAAAGKVAVIGFCWGGTLAWLAAARLSGVACGIAYYGTAIHAHQHERPRAPMLLHFGDQDAHIPPEHVREIAAAHRELPIYRYDAGHGFNCDQRAAFHAPSAALAGERTQHFLESHLC